MIIIHLQEIGISFMVNWGSVIPLNDRFLGVVHEDLSFLKSGVLK